MEKKLTKQQIAVIENQKKNLIVSASAGSGKTFVVIEYLIKLICERQVPLSRMLILTFTKAAAGEIKDRLTSAILSQKQTPFLIEQLDEISISDVTTIDAFCEKIIKRNINKTLLSENFVVLDEKESSSLKEKAFARAFDDLAEQEDEDFEKLYFALKRNRQVIFDMVSALGDYLSCQKDGLLDELDKSREEKEAFAKEYLLCELKKLLKNADRYLQQVSAENLPKAYHEYYQALMSIAKTDDDDLTTLCQKITLEKIPSQPRVKFEGTDKEIILTAKEIIKEIVKFAENFSLRPDNIEKCEIVSGIIKLYKVYSQQYEHLKSARGGLDFADLELQARELVKDQDVQKVLQEKYDYIIIDEYQDTNPLQEQLLKQIAQKGHFIGVGDPKQGIYGFRNATMEIMQKDIVDFANSQDGDALFLTGNFRSDPRILNFVNTVFEKLMTKENCQIDYKSTSMLEGLATFEDDFIKPVTVCAILKEKEPTVKPTGVYSVKEDILAVNDQHREEVITIATKIEELLQSKIYDAKRCCFRKVREGDIAVLFRNRSSLMRALARFLQDKGFRVCADVKENLLDSPYAQQILSFVKLSVAFNDDIALASAMNSWLGGFSLDEICELSKMEGETFTQKVFSSQEDKVKNFLEEIEVFKFEINTFGLAKAIENLMTKKDFYLYLTAQEDGLKGQNEIEGLLKVIKSNFDFNAQGFVDYISSSQAESRAGGENDAINLTTIHASKGLEYPIVILAGGGDSLAKTDRNSVNFSEKFGIGAYLYDFDKNIKCPSYAFLANKLSKKEREYVDEIMIFYVALTRAQNHLIITGTIKDNMEKSVDNKHKNYLSIIFSSFGENFVQTLIAQGKIEKENVIFELVSEVEDKTSETAQEKHFKLTNEEELKSYLEFVYPDVYAKMPLKNSVTSLLEGKDKIEREKNSNALVDRDEAINRGNAYHEALKLLNFEKINSINDIDDEFLQNFMTEGYFQLLDKEILFKNIMLIKRVLSNQKPIKEQEFIMSATLDELGVAQSNDEVIVQGIVDLFSLGERNILIDFKFTSIQDENKLINKYNKQIELYSLAIEKAFDKKIDEKYLLSLKNAKLIKI